MWFECRAFEECASAMAQKQSMSKPRLRAAGLRSNGAVSSLLRLSHAAESSRLPSGSALAGWLRRAALPLVSDPIVPR
jgi:hypothetical protein